MLVRADSALDMLSFSSPRNHLEPAVRCPLPPQTHLVQHGDCAAMLICCNLHDIGRLESVCHPISLERRFSKKGSANMPRLWLATPCLDIPVGPESRAPQVLQTATSDPALLEAERICISYFLQVLRRVPCSVQEGLSSLMTATWTNVE